MHEAEICLNGQLELVGARAVDLLFYFKFNETTRANENVNYALYCGDVKIRKAYSRSSIVAF